MRALAIVIFDPAANADPRLAAGLKGMQVDALVFERAPQPLNEDVVHPAALAVHRDPDTSIFQHIGEGDAGELAALVGVEDLRRPVTRKCLFQGRHTKVRIKRVRQPPRQNLAARPIHDRDQIEKAAPHRNVGDVGAPDLVWPADDEPVQKIRIDPCSGCGCDVLGA